MVDKKLNLILLLHDQFLQERISPPFVHEHETAIACLKNG